jgi:hypothetical protein
MTTPDTAPNRAERARRAAFYVAVATEAKDRAGALMAELEGEALAELEATGAAPTWRIPGLGSVPLCLSSPRVEVVDEAAYLRWVGWRHPSEIEEILRVRPAFDEWLRKALAKRGDPPCDDQGEVIPGLAFRPGGQPRGVQLRPEATAKAGAAAAARAYLDGMPALSIEVLS